jgi:hypothetical protein
MSGRFRGPGLVTRSRSRLSRRPVDHLFDDSRWKYLAALAEVFLDLLKVLTPSPSVWSAELAEDTGEIFLDRVGGQRRWRHSQHCSPVFINPRLDRAQAQVDRGRQAQAPASSPTRAPWAAAQAGHAAADPAASACPRDPQPQALSATLVWLVGFEADVASQQHATSDDNLDVADFPAAGTFGQDLARRVEARTKSGTELCGSSWGIRWPRLGPRMLRPTTSPRPVRQIRYLLEPEAETA